MRVGRPPTAAASGTVASISTVPGRNDGLSCLSSSAWPANGTVSTTTVAHLHRLAVLHAFDAAERSGLLGDLRGGGLGAGGVARADDDLLSGAGPAQRQPGAFGAGAADDGDHARLPAVTGCGAMAASLVK